MLFFSGYSYLGMQHHEGFVQLVQEGINQYGWLFPSSRISNTQLGLFEAMEAKLSSLTQTAATACFASGFGSGSVASSLFKEHPVTVCPEAHPAVNKIKQQPLAFDKWAEKTLHIIHESRFDKTPVLIADSVNPLTGEVNDFDFLQYIEDPLILIVDDSHGIGLLGENGEGVVSMLPKKENMEYIFTYSLSKALGINGGAISCTNNATAKAIKQLPDFTGSTSMSPALAHAFLGADKIYTEQRKKLRSNISFMKGSLNKDENIFNDERLPIFILPEQLDEGCFAEHNIIISSFSYPAINGKKINRAVLNALHTENDLSQLASVINSYKS